MWIIKMGQIIEKIASYRVLHYIFALCLLSSLFPFVVYGKYIALAAMVIMALLNTYKRWNAVFLAFWIWAMVCSAVNGVWGQRDVAWTLVMLSATPMLGQSRMSGNVFKALVKLLPLFVFANLVAYILNVNYFYILYQEPNKFCFSGLTSHPQWLGAFTGLACVYTYYYAVIKKNGDRFRCIMAMVFFLMSVELGLLAGSRAALLSAGVTIALMTFLTCDSIYDFLRKSGVVLILLVCLIPVFIQSVEMIEVKQIAQNYIGLSRTNLWLAQIQLIKEHPFWGTGLVGGETGNGWLAVASKTGIPGVIFMFIMMSFVIRQIKEYQLVIPNSMMVVCIFVYLLIHSCFEGYIYTPGYLGCWMFWACVGYIMNLEKLKG